VPESGMMDGKVTYRSAWADSSRIEAALEQLISLGAIYQTSQPSGGRPSTLWSPIPESDCLAEGESHDESTFEETADEESMQEQT
jgi:hypothetical protein